MIYFLSTRPSEPYVWDYANRVSDGGGPQASVLCYEEVLEMDQVPPGLFVFTGLDRFGSNGIRALDEIHTRLTEESGAPPLNHPSRSLGRFELLQALYERGLNEFQVRGAWEDRGDLRHPVFVRDRSRHGGSATLLRTNREVLIEVGWALVRGADLSELIVEEFLDTRGRDGLFRKYSAYIVGDQVLPVSLERGRHWVLRASEAEFTLEGLEEEEEFVRQDPHGDQLQEIRKISRIGFGRIDYAVQEGRVQTWEINTLPLMRRPPGTSPLPEELNARRQWKKAHFKASFQQAWRTLEENMPKAAAVKLGLSRETVTLALKDLSSEVPVTFPQEERYGSIKALLRPLKPLVIPLAGRTIIPLLARWTIRRELRRNSNTKDTVNRS